MPWPETVWPWMRLSLSSSKLLRPMHPHKFDWPRPSAIFFTLPRLEVQGLGQHGGSLLLVYFERISCWRMGILSMLRLNSLASQGKGLRNLICPSLPISNTANPRGRNFLRRAVFSAGFASTSTPHRARPIPLRLAAKISFAFGNLHPSRYLQRQSPAVSPINTRQLWFHL